MRQKPPPNPTRSLVGVVIDGASTYGRSILRGVMRYANLQRRWQLHVDVRQAFESQAHWPHCDGTIIAGASPAIITYLRALSSHLVVCSGAAVPDAEADAVVSLDDEATGALAAQHLLDCHLERFAFYGTDAQRPTVALKRLNGFRAELASRGYPCIASPVDFPSSVDRLTHAHWPQLMKWLAELPKPVGIMTADDTTANDLAAACLAANVGVPDHVAIIGVNNDDLLCETAWPPLSSIEPDFSRVGYLAARILDRLMGGEELTVEQRCIRLPPVSVAKRVSTSVLAVDDPNLADAVRYIREHACDPCSVQDILRVVPVGRRWLERQFTAKFGRSLHDEITRVRMETAQRLLLQPDISLPDIAERCGFSAIQNFTRVFRQITRTTPAAYRRHALRLDHLQRA